METAAGATLAEQAISTTIEATVVGGLALTSHTQPLKAHFSRFATTPDEDPVHSISVVESHAYVFGGQAADGKVAGNEIHIFDLKPTKSSPYCYKCVPAIAEKSGNFEPVARYGHTANALKQRIYVYGGHSGTSVIDEKCIWLFDTCTLKWTSIENDHDSTQPLARSEHWSATWEDSIVIHGGTSIHGSRLKDTWMFHIEEEKWSRLPDLDSFATSVSIAIVDDTLYAVDHSAKGETVVHSLTLSNALSTWQTITVALESPHPSSRTGAALIAVETGVGRKYLIYMLGKHTTPMVDSLNDAEYCSDIWAYQTTATQQSAAAIKDATNESLGLTSERSTWAEIVVQPDEERIVTAGKSHPGPRGYFAAANMALNSIVLWGGITAKNETEGDGWIIKIE